MQAALGWVLTGVWLVRAGGMGCAILLEVFDFADCRQLLGHDDRWGGVDAHALWHAATALLTPLWYAFIQRDVGPVEPGSEARPRGRGEGRRGTPVRSRTTGGEGTTEAAPVRRSSRLAAAGGKKALR